MKFGQRMFIFKTFSTLTIFLFFLIVKIPRGKFGAIFIHFEGRKYIPNKIFSHGLEGFLDIGTLFSTELNKRNVVFFCQHLSFFVRNFSFGLKIKFVGD